MSTYAKSLFNGKPKHFLKDCYEDHSSLFYKAVYEVELEDIHDALVDVNTVRKPSRKTCRLRDFLWRILYSKYHDHTDAYLVPDRDQFYWLGKMEIFR